jgi:GT2 family glycosyltransferase
MECIHSLQRSSFPNLHIVVVDNGSVDGTVDALASIFGAAVDVIVCQDNLGFAHAVNKGVDFALASNTDFVLILNNDVIVDEAMIGKLVGAMVDSPPTGLAGPVIYYADSRNRIWRTGDRNVWGPPFTRHVFQRELGTQPMKVDYITGCGMLVKREVFESIGKFSEDYRMYFEDADFCRRTQMAGFDIRVIPQARMWHKVSLSTRRMAPQRIYDQTRGRVVFLRRHTPRIFRALTHVYIWIRLFVFGGRSLLQGDTESARAMLRGTLAGYTFFGQRERQSMAPD